MAQYDGTITLQTKVDTSGIKKSSSNIKSAANGIANSFKGIAASIGLALGVGALVNFSKKAIELASDLQEVQNVVDVAFGDMKYKMEQFANTAIETYGISKLTAKRTGSTYMAMAKGMGIASEEASNMALKLTGLSADMASFYNVSQELADIALKSVFTGETETLKQYGIVMTQVNLQEYARQQGITKSIQKMTQQEQVMLRYNYIMQQTALAQGDFSRTSLSWANQTRVLTERWKEMQSTFGEAFMSIATLALPAVNALIKGLTAIANIAKVAAVNIAAIFGKKLDTSSGNTSSNVSNISTGLGNAATNADETADNIGGIGKAAKKANKEINKTVAAFDELNILSSSTSESAGSGGGGGGAGGIGNIGAGGIEAGGESIDYMGEANKINEALAVIMAAVGASLVAVGLILLFTGHPMLGIGFIIAGATTFGVSMASLSSSDISKETQQTLSAIMGIISGALVAIGIILLYLGSTAMGIGFIIAGASALGVTIVSIKKFNENKIINSIMVIQGVAGGALLALGLILLYFSGATPLSIGLIIAGAAILSITAAQLVSNQVPQDVANMINLITGIASAALLALGIILCCVGVVTPLSIGLIVAGAVGLASEIALNYNAIQTALIDFLKNNSGLIIGISTALLVLGIVLLCVGVISPLSIGLIVAGAVGLASEIALNWTAITSGISNFIKSNSMLIVGVGIALVVLGIVLLFCGIIPLGLGLLVAGGASLAAVIYANKNEILNIVKNVWQSITIFWNTNIAPWFTAEKWQGLASKIGEGLKNGFRAAANGVIGIFETAINWIISKLNLLSIDIPEGVPGIGGKTFGVHLNTIKIPRLARGAVLPPNKPFLSVVGDQKSGTNVETPLATMIEAFNIALQNNGGYGNQPIIIEIDGREFGRAVINQGNREAKRTTGKLVFA